MPLFDARSRRVTLSAASLLVAALALAFVLDPLREGLNATVYADDNWSSSIARSLVDARISTEGLIGAWRGRPPSAFSATWSGAFVALAEDTYTFATMSDDGSSVYVDRELVVDNGGPHDARLVKGSVHLGAGVHAIFVTYFQRGG